MKSDTRGMSLIEIVVGAAIVATALVGAVAAFNLYVQSGLATTTKLRAAYIAEAGVEASRAIRDADWGTFAALDTDTPYYLTFATSTGWEATSTVALIDERFTRTVTFSNVYRRSSDDDIVPVTSGETKYLDTNTKKVSVLVSWGAVEAEEASFEEGSTDGDLASFPSDSAGDGNPAQSFTTGSDAFSLGKVDLFLKRVGTPSDLYLEVRSGSPVGLVVATSNTVSPGSISADNLEWIAFQFSTEPELSAETEYWLRLRSTPPSTEALSGSEGTIHWGYLQEAGSPYADGQARRYVGRQGDDDDQGQLLAQYDFSFRVYSSGGGDAVEAVTYLANIFE